MKSVEIFLDKEVVFDLSKFSTSWLTKLVKSEELTIDKIKPSYPSLMDPKKKFTINHNYDSMTGTITYDPQTKTLKGSGYGWISMVYCFE